jgi:hypothetical protein
MKQILICFIPSQQMRYGNTWGDWYYDRDQLIIDVTNELPSESHMVLVALHEFVEAILCRKRGISQNVVDQFDIPFDRDFDGVHYEGELGDHPQAPYGHEHRFAMLIEHLMAHELGISGYGRIE